MRSKTILVLASFMGVAVVGNAHGAVVSGSGPTTAFLCEGPEHAEEVDQILQDQHGTRPGLVVRGPVHGARLAGGHS